MQNTITEDPILSKISESLSDKSKYANYDSIINGPVTFSITTGSFKCLTSPSSSYLYPLSKLLLYFLLLNTSKAPLRLKVYPLSSRSLFVESPNGCMKGTRQWHNVTICRPPPSAVFLAPHKKLNLKRLLFWRPLLAFLAPPGAFCTPIFLRRPNAYLGEIFTVCRYKNS